MKRIAVFFASVCITLSSLCLAGCEHVCDWGDWSVTKTATCIEAAKETRVCLKNSSHIETRSVGVPAGHKYGEWTVSSVATECNEASTEKRLCTNSGCSHYETRSSSKLLGHDWDGWIVIRAATCVAEGSETRTCQRDTRHVETRAIPINLNAHDAGQWKVISASTCTGMGARELHCTRCDTALGVTESTAVLGHDAGQWHVTQQATCTETGSRELRCTRCQTVLESENINALEHDSGKWHVVTAETCTVAGLKELRCTKCQAVIDSDVIAPKDHAYGDWVTRTQATCDYAEKQRSTCAHNSHHYLERYVGDPLGHDEGMWHIRTESTCTQEGVRELRCTRCQTVLETQPIANLEHQPIIVTYYYDYDGDGEIDEEVSATLIEEVIAPTCTSTGEGNIRCSLCDEIYETGAEIAALGHIPTRVVVGQNDNNEDIYEVVYEEVSAPVACTTPGVSGYRCSRCNEIYQYGVISEHDEGEWFITIPATCLPGEQELRCTLCQEVIKTSAVAGHGHEWGEWIDIVPATCESSGSRTRICEIDSYVDTWIIPPLGHKWGEWVETVPPTCVLEGVGTRICKENPEHIDTRSVAALGHNYHDGSCTRCYELEP